MARAHAPTVSRLIRRDWSRALNYEPTVTQMGDAVLVESRSWMSIGWAADTLAKRGEYEIKVGGQWLTEKVGDGFISRFWNGWLDVKRLD